ncbi:hypothetical protein BKA62DRAFT_365361 [Auriculariales sp. MPI-PUGE-AT-0066]|nr:hypothetical protein BKA62DRAFT_365361 [Auriculariales sp. MPI-PUGE-AT-0066]
MKRLDTDTLACVFEWTAFQAEYCQFGSGFDGSAWPRPLPAAFTLAAVCQTWRAVVLRTSFLWRDVQYCVNDELENDDVPLYIALLLERSGICTLNLVVQYTTFADTVKLANKTLSALMPRVRRLHVDVAWPCVPPSICDDSLSCLQLPTPHLEICSVFHEKQFDHELFSNVRWYPGAFLPYTPKLTVLLAGMIPLHTVGHALVNLITLSSFDQSWLGARISVDQILQRCPSLQSIGVVSSSISGHNSAQDPVETERPIIPISLQSIASGISVLLRGHGPVDFSGLTHLDLTEPADATIWSTPEASIFLSKGTFPRLVSLVIPFLDCEQNSDVRLFICAQYTQNLSRE